MDKKTYEKNEKMEAWTEEQWAEYEDECKDLGLTEEEMKGEGVSTEELLAHFEKIKI